MQGATHEPRPREEYNVSSQERICINTSTTTITRNVYLSHLIFSGNVYVDRFIFKGVNKH